MFVLIVAAFGAHQKPAVFLKHFKDITDFHRETLLWVIGAVKSLSPVFERGNENGINLYSSLYTSHLYR